MANANTLYANLFVHELVKSGLKHVVFVPGSRHTPLILAFAHHQDHIKIWSHLDERSASFFALGLALASDAPVAIICTSGSAGANMLPAIVEAHQSRIPLIIITADRPHELRYSGANQTIDQIKFFGDYVRWFVDAPLPEPSPSESSLRNLGMLAHRAFHTANGMPKGVVHVNIPFRKPLEPDGDEATLLESLYKQVSPTHFSQVFTILPETEIHRFVDTLLAYDKGIIVCGTRTPRHALPLIAILARKTGFPVLADAISGMRSFDKVNEFIIGGYDTALMHDGVYHNPDIVVRFGDVPVSKWLNDYLGKIQPEKRLHISADGVWADDQHHTTDFIHADPYHLLRQAFKYRLGGDLSLDLTWAQNFITVEKTLWETLDAILNKAPFFDGIAVHDVVELIPDESVLFVGNSLPVRHLDQFAQPTQKHIHIYASRGASGIDGNVSTALGLGGAHPNKPLVAILGDITLYHDMNGLLAIRRLDIPMTLVVLNNDGGGIFHRLPIHEHEPEFTEYFITAHGLDYEHVAKLYDLRFVRVDERLAFREAFTQSITSQTSSLIEVKTHALQDLAHRRQVIQAIHEAIALSTR